MSSEQSAGPGGPAAGGGGQDDAYGVDRATASALAEGLQALAGASVEPEVAGARAAGQSVRRIIDRLTATSAPPQVLRAVAERLDEVMHLLDPYSEVRGYRGASEASGLPHDRAFYDWSPLLGLANPLAPPIRVAVEDTTVVGRVRFGIAYEGPPGCVHGGYIAAAFDEVLGLTQSLSGVVGMTGTLSVRYRQPTPLHRDLRLEGRVQSVVGRKVLTTGRLLDGDQLTAEATGLFISISPEKFRSLGAQRQA